MVKEKEEIKQEQHSEPKQEHVEGAAKDPLAEAVDRLLTDPNARAAFYSDPMGTLERMGVTFSDEDKKRFEAQNINVSSSKQFFSPRPCETSDSRVPDSSQLLTQVVIKAVNDYLIQLALLGTCQNYTSPTMGGDPLPAQDISQLATQQQLTPLFVASWVSAGVNAATQTRAATSPVTQTAAAINPATQTAVATNPVTHTSVTTNPVTQTRVATNPGIRAVTGGTQPVVFAASQTGTTIKPENFPQPPTGGASPYSQDMYQSMAQQQADMSNLLAMQQLGLVVGPLVRVATGGTRPVVNVATGVAPLGSQVNYQDYSQQQFGSMYSPDMLQLLAMQQLGVVTSPLVRVVTGGTRPVVNVATGVAPLGSQVSPQDYSQQQFGASSSPDMLQLLAMQQLGLVVSPLVRVATGGTRPVVNVATGVAPLGYQGNY
ncbi:MAG: hypothetical protein ACM3SY_06165 [Candidatus Omnitrophota bacterium]